MKGNEVPQVQRQSKAESGANLSWPREMSWPSVQLGGRCRRPERCGLVHNHRMKGNEVPQVQRQSKAEPGANLNWPCEMSSKRVQLIGRCLRSAPLQLVYKSENEMERMSQVLRPCKQPWGATGSWPGELSFPMVEQGGRCRRPAPCGLAQNETEQCPRCNCNASCPWEQPGGYLANCLGLGLSWAVGVGAQALVDLYINIE